MKGPTWAVERVTGSAAAFHALELPDPLERTVWVFDVDRPALVLGSTQPDASVDAVAAKRAGVEVVRRRSGGGAVLLRPGEAVWIDVLLPRADPLWDDDVGHATHWLGDVWAATIGAGAVVHRRGALRSRWSSLVCFGGLGPGEVLARDGGPKVVGLSQRRTRLGARFQCAVLGEWDAVGILGLLALSPHEREEAALELADDAAGVALDGLAERFVGHLPA
ncbi:MAG: lipoate---protein ligase [Acidimicrobiaceae bacterium]